MQGLYSLTSRRITVSAADIRKLFSFRLCLAEDEFTVLLDKTELSPRLSQLLAERGRQLTVGKGSDRASKREDILPRPSAKDRGEGSGIFGIVVQKYGDF